MTGSRLPMLVGSSSSLPLSFGTPRQLGKGKLHGSPFENITTFTGRPRRRFGNRTPHAPLPPGDTTMVH
uniref:Putative secreted peptide n=1 Tax=Anopheles braziliensis TaxID=58242 RepID=A0A2M3ZX15_9DIPT